VPGSREALDSLMEDATEAQKRRGHIPTPQEVQDFFTGVLVEIDAKEAAKAGRPEPKAAPPPPVPLDEKLAQMQEAYNKKGGHGPLQWVDPATVQKPIDTPEVRKLDHVPQNLRKRLQARIKLLTERNTRGEYKRPDFAHRMKTAWAGAFGLSRHQALAAMYDILEDSNRLFGDWRKPPPRKLWSTGSSRGGVQG
jgi:hypothetical protein